MSNPLSLGVLTPNTLLLVCEYGRDFKVLKKLRQSRSAETALPRQRNPFTKQQSQRTILNEQIIGVLTARDLEVKQLPTNLETCYRF